MEWKGAILILRVFVCNPVFLLDLVCLRLDKNYVKIFVQSRLQDIHSPGLIKSEIKLCACGMYKPTEAPTYSIKTLCNVNTT